MVNVEDTARVLPVAFVRADEGVARLTRWVGRLREPKVSLQVALFLGILSMGIVVRLHFASLLDPFEDPYQNWWISANLAETGQYWDRFSMMTHGNWLPLYHFVGAATLLVAGLQNFGALKLVNIALSMGTAGLVFYVGNLRSRAVGFAGMAFFSADFIDMVISGWATSEALVTFLVFLGVAALFMFPGSTKRNRTIAAASLLLAAMTQYEAWLVVTLLVGYGLLRKAGEPSRKEILWVAAPAMAFMGLYFLYASQWGFLPQIVVNQTSTDIRYQLAAGSQLPPLDILSAWWSGYLWRIPPVLILGGAYALLKARKEYVTWIIVSLWGFIVAYTILQFGNPSFRYVMITVPFLAILAAAGIERLVHWAMTRHPSRRLSSRIAVPAVLAGCVGLVMVSMVPPPATYWSGGYAAVGYMEPLVKAGEFVSGLPLPAGKLLITESPVSAYYSGYAPDRILGSRYLPDNRSEALAFLRQEVAYVVYMGVPYYPLRTLFPELENGTSTPNFTLLYDAGGQAAGWHAVYVYEVVA